MHPIPIILFSGMGADERLLAAQREAFPQLRVPRWIAHRRWESLPDYARRLAAEIDPHETCWIGGVSLGGMMALEVSRHLRAKGCLLIGTVHHPRELPWWLQLVRRPNWLAAIATWPLRFGPASGKVLRLLFGWSLSAPVRSALDQLCDANGAFLSWATWALLTWQPETATPAAPVFHIHGRRDWLLPGRRTTPDMFVANAGHLIAATHPAEVTAFLRSHVDPGIT